MTNNIVYVFDSIIRNTRFSMMSKEDFEIAYGLDKSYDDWRDEGGLFDEVMDFTDKDEAIEWAKNNMSEEDYQDVLESIGC